MFGNTFLIIAVILICIVIRMRVIGVVFSSVNTLIHELGHAFIALILGGKVGQIKLNDNASGSCTTSSKSSFKAFLVSLSGYVASASFSYFIFYSIGKSWNVYFFWFFLITSSLALIFWMRNTFAVVWTLIFASLNLAIILIPKIADNYSNYFLLIIGLLVVIENIIGCLYLLKLSIFESKKAGDAANIAKATKIPAFFWALGFLAYSIWLAYLSFTNFYPLFK